MADRTVQHIDPEQVKRASAALLRHLQESESRKPAQQLIEEDEVISLIITLKQIPTERKAKPIIIPLAHSLAPEDQEICVFTKDPQEEHKAKLLEVPGVIGLTKLRKNYKTFETKRKLVSSYDLFLTDDRIVTFMPALLGKAFYEKKRNPIPISLTKSNLAAQIKNIQSSSLMFVNTGACFNVKIARSSFTAEQVTANVLAALPKIVDRVPKHWANVQALHLKSTSSVSLPIYTSLPDSAVASTNNVQTEKRKLPEPARAESKSTSGTPKKARKESAEEATSAVGGATPKKSAAPAAKTGTPKVAAQSTPKAAAPAKEATPKAATPKAAAPTQDATSKAATPKAAAQATPKKTPAPVPVSTSTPKKARTEAEVPKSAGKPTPRPTRGTPKRTPAK